MRLKASLPRAWCWLHQPQPSIPPLAPWLDGLSRCLCNFCAFWEADDGKHGKMTWHYFGSSVHVQRSWCQQQIAPVIDALDGFKDFDRFDDCWPVRWYFCYLGSGRCSGRGPTHVVFRQSGLGHPTLGGDASHLHAVLVAIPGAPWYPIFPASRIFIILSSASSATLKNMLLSTCHHQIRPPNDTKVIQSHRISAYSSIISHLQVVCLVTFSPQGPGATKPHSLPGWRTVATAFAGPMGVQVDPAEHLRHHGVSLSNQDLRSCWTHGLLTV